MKTTLNIFSIISIVLGFFAIIGSALGGADAGYSFIGGLFFLTEGVLAEVYIAQKEKIIK